MEVIKKRTEKEIKSGVWLVIKNRDLYTKSDEKDLSQLAKKLNAENIKLFTCLSKELPDGWRSVTAD